MSLCLRVAAKNSAPWYIPADKTLPSRLALDVHLSCALALTGQILLMLFLNKCESCRGRLRRSQVRNILQFLIAPLVVPYRCVRCGLPGYRARFVVRFRKNTSGRTVVAGGGGANSPRDLELHRRGLPAIR